MAGSRWTSAGVAAICLFVLALGLWNVSQYPPGRGYDAAEHMAYADGLVPGGHLPGSTGRTEYYTPPGFYAVAGSVDWVAGKVRLGERHRAATALNVLLLLGTVLLVWRIALELFPGRDRLSLGAAAFVALVPVAAKNAAMFHPETLSLFCSTLALWLCVRTFADRRYAIALGVVLGAAQLVRAWALVTVAAVMIALLVARRWREAAIVVALAAVIPAPWYVHQRVEHGGSPVFNRPTVTKPIYERRPLGFFVDPGLPDVVSRPYRANFLNRALPTTYTELWGDYFGIWAWSGRGQPSSHARHLLQLQSLAGLLPTLLAVGGWLAFLLASLRSPPRLALALLPPLGILAYLYFTVGYPTPDGDVLKATYMLTTTAGWALGFGYALDRLRSRILVAALAVCAIVQLPFLLYSAPAAAAAPTDVQNHLAAWSPDGGRIAFTSNRDGNYELYVMDADGGDPRRLTDDPAEDGGPAWSPDGRQIVFSSDRAGNFELYVMPAEGGAARRLTRSRGLEEEPDWSRRGTIAFASTRDGNDEIYAVRPDGRGLRNLTRNRAGDGGQAWSPDGRLLAFNSDRAGNSEIYVMRADGSGVRRLTRNVAADGFPTWSPDGRRIAFLSDRGGDSAIYVMRADGSRPRRIAAGASVPAWSPDGRQIAFTSDRTGSAELYVIPAAGGTPRRLT